MLLKFYIIDPDISGQLEFEISPDDYRRDHVEELKLAMDTGHPITGDGEWEKKSQEIIDSQKRVDDCLDALSQMIVRYLRLKLSETK